MANVLTAGNSSNGGTAISTDTSGTLNIVTGSGSGANAITIDASQNVAMTASQTIAGNLTVTGTLSASGGVSGSITSGTAVSVSGTSVTFTGIPSTVKRITVMFNGVSTSGTSNIQIQLGTSGGIQTSSYDATAAQGDNGASVASIRATSGFIFTSTNANTYSWYGNMTITNFGSNTWTETGALGRSVVNNAQWSAGGVTLSGTLDRVRITTINGTDTFDAGSINILYE
jgi:hypothetical protein